jgi:replication factor C subunit 3/5
MSFHHQQEDDDDEEMTYDNDNDDDNNDITMGKPSMEEEEENHQQQPFKKLKPINNSSSSSETENSPNKKRQRTFEQLTTVDDDSHLPFVEKYRPSNLSDIVAQDDIISTLTRLMESNQLPHLLMYGPPGTGKTSTILAVARKMYGTSNLSSMVMELNASDARGIDDIREQVVTFASTRKIFSSGMKLIILDEADNMTRDAQFALRRIIEKYTSNTRFCLICNYVSKIIPALQSRCTRFRFSPLAPENVIDRVKEIANAEHIITTEDGIHALIKLGKGDMRKILNLLESSTMQSTTTTTSTTATTNSNSSSSSSSNQVIVNAKLVYTVAGKPTPGDVLEISNSLWNDPVSKAISVLEKMQIERGLALNDIVTEMHEDIRQKKIPNKIVIYVLAELANAEYRLAGAVDDRIQRAGLVSIFQLARKMIADGL